jgi:hypothetical protein
VCNPVFDKILQLFRVRLSPFSAIKTWYRYKRFYCPFQDLTEAGSGFFKARSYLSTVWLNPKGTGFFLDNLHFVHLRANPAKKRPLGLINAKMYQTLYLNMVNMIILSKK